MTHFSSTSHVVLSRKVGRYTQVSNLIAKMTSSHRAGSLGCLISQWHFTAPGWLATILDFFPMQHNCHHSAQLPTSGMVTKSSVSQESFLLRTVPGQSSSLWP